MTSMTGNGVIPYLLSNDCAKHAQWICDILGAEETSRHPSPCGKFIMHMSLSINGGEIYMADINASKEECDQNSAKIEESKGVQRGMHIYVDAEDVDETWKKAMAAGGTEHVKLENKFWGDRYGIFKDPWGYLWSIASPDQKKEQNEHLQISKLHQHAVVPTKPQNGKVGYSLHAVEDTTIPVNECVKVDTGLSIMLPKHTFGRIAPPSCIEEDLQVQNMILDGCQQQLKLQVKNLSKVAKKIEKGTEIGQLVIEKSMLPEITLEK